MDPFGDFSFFYDFLLSFSVFCSLDYKFFEILRLFNLLVNFFIQLHFKFWLHFLYEHFGLTLSLLLFVFRPLPKPSSSCPKSYGRTPFLQK